MKLSVIMPVYNEERTLEEIVGRVLATPYDKELLLVDDGSSDRSREIMTELDDQVNDMLASIGLQYAFGDKPEPAAIDSDNDGVIDPSDMCPGTPAGRTVDSRGCELDSDGDGVVDGSDACPGTPAGTAVDTRGCPLDSDGDGVLDGADDCPNTPAGTRAVIHR